MLLPEGTLTGVTDPAAGDPTTVQQPPQAQPEPAPIADPVRGTYDPNAAPAGDPQQGPIPYDRFQQVNNEKGMLAQQVEQLRQQNQLYSAQLGQYQQGQSPQAPPPTQAAQPPQPQPDPMVELLKDVDDEDMVEGKKVKQIAQAFGQQIHKLAAVQGFMATHPDYGNLVGTPQNLAAPMQEVLQMNNNVAMDIAQSANPMQTAYNYAAMYTTLKQQLAQQNAPQAQGNPPPQQMQPPPGPPAVHPSAVMQFNASRMPASPANAGSGTGFSQAHQIASMSADQFAQRRANVIAKGG